MLILTIKLQNQITPKTAYTAGTYYERNKTSKTIAEIEGSNNVSVINTFLEIENCGLVAVFKAKVHFSEL